MECKAKNIFDVASSLVYGDRNKSYGHPRDNFQTTADMWNAYLARREMSHEAKYEEAFQLESVDVAYMMVLMKMARLAHDPAHTDSLIDVLGYVGCAERLNEVDK